MAIVSAAFDDLNASRKTVAIDRDRIIRPVARRRPIVRRLAANRLPGPFVNTPGLHPIKQGLGLRVAQGALVAKQDQLSRCHLAAGRRTVVIKHLLKRLPEQLEIVF